MAVIYKIENSVNGRIYIGATTNFMKRKSTHISKMKSKTLQNKKLLEDVILHGHEMFSFSILEECGAEFLPERELFYLDLLKPYYNSYFGSLYGLADNRKNLKKPIISNRKEKLLNEKPPRIKPQKIKISIEEFKIIMREKTKSHWDSLSEEERKKRNAHKIGRVFSEETKRKLREKRAGRKPSEETKRKVSMKLKGRKKTKKMN
jgi:group I intron endonuclease